MKRTFLALLVILLIGCTRFGSTEKSEMDICRNMREGRGIVVEFADDSPPSEITEGRKFTVGMKFANYKNKDSQAMLQVKDYIGSDISGGLRDGFSDAVNVEGAKFSGSSLISPGCKIVGENIGEKYVGTFTYSGLKYDETGNMLAIISYDDDVRAAGKFCVYRARSGESSACRDRETISGSNLGPENSYSAVTVSNVIKTITLESQDTQSINVNLDILIENVGGGFVENNKVDFEMRAGDANFKCYFKNKSGQRLELGLKEGEARVSCDAIISVDREKDIVFNVLLNYNYKYSVYSDEFIIKDISERT